jgi:hypothetical protein
LAQQQLSTVAAIGLTVGVFGFVAVILGFVFMFGPGHVFVVAPSDRALEVSVDGGKPEHVRAGGHVLLNLGQGTRSIHFAPVDGPPVDVTVDVPSGFANQLAMLPGTCFAEVDVTDSHYGRGDGRAELIEVHRAPGAVLTGVPVFRESELPAHISENVRQTLVSEVPCDAATPGEVLRSLHL